MYVRRVDPSVYVSRVDPSSLTFSPIYDCRCDERLKPKDDESTCLAYTELFEELEYLKTILCCLL